MPDDLGLRPDGQALVLRLLAELARTTPDRLDASFDRALAELGRFAGADRCYIFEFQPDDTVRNTYEWVATGVAPEIQNLAAVPSALVSEWVIEFRAGRPVHLPDIADLPDRSDLQDILAAQGIRALLVVPLADHAAVHGFIGFDNIRAPEPFPPSVVALLQAAAGLIWTMLDRVRAERRKREADDRMQALLSAMPDLVFELDAGACYTGRAAGPPQMMLVPPDARAGKHVSEVLPPHVAPEYEAGVAEALRDGVTRPRRYMLRHRERLMWHEATFAPIGTAAGKIMCHIRDVTADELTRQRLERLGKAAEMMTNHVVLTDRQGCVIWANRAFVERSGHAVDDMLGRPIQDFTRSPNTDPNVAARIAEAMTSGAPFRGEIVNRTRAGQDYWIDLNISEARDTVSGEPVVINVATDVTELKETRDRLANVIEGAAAGTWDWSCGQDRVRVNARFATMLGRAHDELADMPVMVLAGLIAPQDRARILAVMERLRIGLGETFETEFRMLSGAGDPVWVEVRGRVLALRPDGTADRVSGVMIDISERKTAEEELRRINACLKEAVQHRDAAERRFRDIAALSDDWFFELDDGLAHCYISENFGNIVGIAGADLIGRPLRALAADPQDGDPADWRALEARLAARETVSGFLFGRGAGRAGRTWLRLSLAPHFDPESGAFIGYRGVGSDVTALNTERLRALEASRAKGQMLATMSHEIRTPLNSILGMAELMEPHLKDDRQREMLATIRGSGEMLVGMLNNLLDMSRIEAGQLELASRPVNLRALFDDAMRIWRAQAQSRRLDFELLFGPGAEAGRLGDAHRLQQILQNLVSNAFKFTSAGRIAVRLSARPGRPVIVEVSDTGIGMTASQVRTVFDPYQQADSGIVARYGGTGLGLSIVRDLVALMKGEIGVQSEPDKGTTFRLTLPLPEIPALDDAEAVAPAVPEAGSAETAFAGRRVLVADDSATNLAVATGMLHGTGVALSRAEDGCRAVELWEAESAARPGAPPFDLLLLDIAMPRVDGVATLARIRAAAEAAGLAPPPAVAVTANVMTDQIADYVQGGFDAVLAKPFRRQQLHAIVRTVLAEAPAGQGAARPAAPRRRAALPAVLLADDDRVTREVFAGFLATLGRHEVTEAEDGRAALIAGLTRPFGLIVIDRNMPRLTGDRVIRALRAGETPNRDTAIVMATGEVTALQPGRPDWAEPDLYLPKPVDARHFAHAVHLLLGTE